ncbi:hypothetical protein [Pseudarthrobacter sp. CCNWLW207]|uniref:hypothetical protein n=1 Tax=Pseudarthrobacter sp. CCNWLW207 TaxID=3127468 RepID=UPI003FD343C0
MSISPTVVVCGPAWWNQLILLDHLPEPVPHMQFARRSWQTLGGTSAGKALHLADLGISVRLCSPLGADDDGALVAAADLAVIDLSELGVLLLERDEVRQTPLWVDLHDYSGSSSFHEPFLRAADAVFMNDDRTGDPWELMSSCLEQGPYLAVCTRGQQVPWRWKRMGRSMRLPQFPLMWWIRTAPAMRSWPASWLRPFTVRQWGMPSRQQRPSPALPLRVNTYTLCSDWPPPLRHDSLIQPRSARGG